MDKIIVSYCMGCGKVKVCGQWIYSDYYFDNPDNYRLSHGYCEPCGEKAVDYITKNGAEDRKSEILEDRKSEILKERK